MSNTIIDFRNYYAASYANGVRTFLSTYGSILIDRIKRTLNVPRATLYIFGNGGSHAISKCLKYAIQDYAEREGLFVRIETGVDVNQICQLEENIVPGISFVDVLKREGADQRDLIILISGSGNSDNLCDVARYAKSLLIPTFALIGSKKGRLRKYIDPSQCFITPIDDQQICEDIMQSLVFLFEIADLPSTDTDRDRFLTPFCKKLEDQIKQIPESFFEHVAEKVSDLFLSPLSPLWVIGLGHPALSTCAEHTAHNLYWDSVYQISNPPGRNIHSSLTAANLTGISNDRRKNIFSCLMGSRESRGGIVIIYADRLGKPIKKLLKELERNHIQFYVLYSDNTSQRTGDEAAYCRSIAATPQIHAAVSQIFGHILGRIVRMKLLYKCDHVPLESTATASAFLINNDLAQRRLLNA